MKSSVVALCALCALGWTGNTMDVGSFGVAYAQTAVVEPSPAASPTWKLQFGNAKPKMGHVTVMPDTLYTAERGYGLEPGSSVSQRAQCIYSEKAFFLSVVVPEGNYRVTVTLGDGADASNTTVKAEARRLMLENVSTATGKFETRSFIVNVRTPRLPDGSTVRINGREQGPPILNSWDEKLTLEFNGTRPAISAIEITRVEGLPTIFLAGDSTVTDNRNEPWSAWGQMLPRFFKPTVAVANYAEGGLTLGTFRGQNRLAKLLSTIKKGDYVLVQFGHNDQKDKGENAGPFKNYKTNLKNIVADIRAKEGIPVLLTPMERRRWADGKPGVTLAGHAEAVRQVGREEAVPVIDLNAMSLQLYAALGEEGSKKAFVHFPAGTFPNQTEDLKDNTHFTNYGGYEMARVVLNGIREKVPSLVPFLAEDVPVFDVTKPDPFEQFAVPLSPLKEVQKPAGS